MDHEAAFRVKSDFAASNPARNEVRGMIVGRAAGDARSALALQPADDLFGFSLAQALVLIP